MCILWRVHGCTTNLPSCICQDRHYEKDLVYMGVGVRVHGCMGVWVYMWRVYMCEWVCI